MKYYITVTLSKGSYIHKEYSTIQEARTDLQVLQRNNVNKTFKLRQDNTV